MIPRPRAGRRLCETWNNWGRPRTLAARARQARLCLRWAWRVLWSPDLVRTEVFRSSACIGIMENRERRERGDERLFRKLRGPGVRLYEGGQA